MISRPRGTRGPLRYEQTPFEARVWNAADAAAEGYPAQSARLYREAAESAPTPEEKADCLEKAAMMERRAGGLTVMAVCSTWASLVRAGGDPRADQVCLDEVCPIHKVVSQ